MKMKIGRVTRRVETAVIGAVQEFLKLESAGGILLVLAAALAMIFKNTHLADAYDSLLATPVAIRIGGFGIFKPLLLWINDGLMAIFFFLVGLELKREVLEGELSRLSQVVLPLSGAIGGMAVPALIYAWLNRHDAIALNGWAIPSATDIAFALGVLLLLGKRVHPRLKIFLMTLAILDDLGAIVIIAIFYTSELSLVSLAVAGSALVVLTYMNWRGVTSIPVYLLVGLVMWAAVLKSGVHATLAGVALAWFIPLRDARDAQKSPLRLLEHDLHPPVAYAILPLFAFANGGLSLKGVDLATILTPVTSGVAAGLFVGKQLGVFGGVWLAIRLGLAKLPGGIGWSTVYGVALLAGVGFTMSLFIGSLAFEHEGIEHLSDMRLGILVGSIASALAGYTVLRFSLRRQFDEPAAGESK